MATIVNVQQAKTHLSHLLARAEQGEEVVIARAGQPVVRLVPVAGTPTRTFGTMQFTVPDTFFELLPESELGAWE